MATLRNLAIGLIRQAGYTKIAATIRKIKHDTALLLAILGLKNPSWPAQKTLRDTLWSCGGRPGAPNRLGGSCGRATGRRLWTLAMPTHKAYLRRERGSTQRGGHPVSGAFIPAAKPILGEDEQRAVGRVLASNMVTQGPEVRAFEAEFARLMVDGRVCVAVNSGTSGLHLGLLAAGIGVG